MRSNPQFRVCLCLVCLMLCVTTAAAGGKTLTLVAGGDVEWAGRDIRGSESIFFDNGGTRLADGGWQPIPRVIDPHYLEQLDPGYVEELMARINDSAVDLYGVPIGQAGVPLSKLALHDLEFDSLEDWAEYPFRKVASVFRKADVAFLNIETPLSDHAYRVGAFRTPEIFVRGLQLAGIDVVSTANNHAMDSERQGMFDTIRVLEEAGISAVGSGEDLAAARDPEIIEVNGVRLAFLAYTQYENSGTNGFATSKRAGVAPLDPLVIKEDIAAVRDRVDHVVLSFHWDIYQFDIERSQELHPDAVTFAHEMVDAGADAILGHHAHVPRAIEVYKGAPIFYSMGHLIFSFTVPHWRDNYLPRVTFSKEKVERIEIIPVAGRMHDLAQPYPVEGERAAAAIANLQELSEGLGTKIDVEGSVGVVKLPRRPL